MMNTEAAHRQHVLDPAEAVIDDVGRMMTPLTVIRMLIKRLSGAMVRARHTLDAGLAGFQVHDVEQRDVRDHRRQDACLITCV
jgi:hypothetical protein